MALARKFTQKLEKLLAAAWKWSRIWWRNTGIMELLGIYLKKGAEVLQRTKRSIIRYHTLDEIANGLERHQLHWENPDEAKFGKFEGQQLHFGPFGTKNSGVRAQHRTLRFFMQHNGTLHVTRASLEWFSSRNIPVRGWPALFPHLNPIENVWALMKRGITEKWPKSLLKMARIILSSGQNFYQRTVQNLINSMSRRIQSCLDTRGGTTKYEI